MIMEVTEKRKGDENNPRNAPSSLNNRDKVVTHNRGSSYIYNVPGLGTSHSNLSFGWGEVLPHPGIFYSCFFKHTAHLYTRLILHILQVIKSGSGPAARGTRPGPPFCRIINPCLLRKKFFKKVNR
jgi:hypothetical protein